MAGMGISAAQEESAEEVKRNPG